MPFRTLATLGLLSLCSHLGAAEITAEALPHLPEFWPSHLKLKEQTTVEVEGRERTILPLINGVVVRVSEQGVLADFGSSGRHLFPLEATDILTRAEAIQADPKLKPTPLLQTQIGDKFWRWNGENMQRLGGHYFEHKDYFVFLYAEPQEATSVKAVAKLSQAYDEIVRQSPEAEVVLLSANREVQPFFDQDAPEFPVMVWHMSKGYIYALAHPLDQRPAVVVTDANNRILYPTEGTADFPEVADWAGWIHDLIERDQAQLAADPVRAPYLQQ